MTLDEDERLEPVRRRRDQLRLEGGVREWLVLLDRHARKLPCADPAGGVGRKTRAPLASTHQCQLM
jgi:hypothetical protein